MLVFPASLGIGGSQLNAVELAIAMRDRGHEVWTFGPEGPLCDTIARAGLPFIPAPARPKVRPSPSVMRALVKAVSANSIDLVHGYEWPPILEAAYGPYLRHHTAVVGTVFSMGVAPFIPAQLPLIVGSAQIAESERARRKDVRLIEPPVDTSLNRSWPDVRDARAAFDVGPDDLLVVVVSRLADELKREGILAAIRGAGVLASDLPIRMVVVGDGPARAEIEAAAATVNVQAARQVVTLTGAMNDPRPAYAAADITFGMGSSALRAMAFAKPLVVQGERGFWRLLTPDSLPQFLYQGFYGIGGDGTPAFVEVIRGLASDPARRAELGAFARSVVQDRFSLDRAAKGLEEIYLEAQRDLPSRRRALAKFAGPMAEVVGHEVHWRYARWRGTAVADDFNALSMQPGAANQQTEGGQ